MSKENTDRGRNIAFICSEILVSLNFILEKCVACYISVKKFNLFILIF